MQSHSVRRMVLMGLALALVLLPAGCGPAPTLMPTSAPTVDVQPTYDAISTQAVQTMAADLTRNAPTATPIMPTDTPAPTATQTLTNTPAPTSTPTRVFIPWTATPTATQPAYSCTVTGVSPTTSTTIKVDQDFDAEWSVKNNGTQTWYSGNTDIRYVDGTRLHTSLDIKDLTSSVTPNGVYKVVVDMKAPSTDGAYSTVWGIYLEDGSVCTLNLQISVTK